MGVPMHDRGDELEDEDNYREKEENTAEWLRGHLGTGHYTADGVQGVILVQHDAEQPSEKVDKPGH